MCCNLLLRDLPLLFPHLNAFIIKELTLTLISFLPCCLSLLIALLFKPSKHSATVAICKITPACGVARYLMTEQLHPQPQEVSLKKGSPTLLLTSPTDEYTHVFEGCLPSTTFFSLSPSSLVSSCMHCMLSCRHQTVFYCLEALASFSKCSLALWSLVM